MASGIVFGLYYQTLTHDRMGIFIYLFEEREEHGSGVASSEIGKTNYLIFE